MKSVVTYRRLNKERRGAIDLTAPMMMRRLTRSGARSAKWIDRNARRNSDCRRPAFAVAYTVNCAERGCGARVAARATVARRQSEVERASRRKGFVGRRREIGDQPP